jgi:hypothetical protein
LNEPEVAVVARVEIDALHLAQSRSAIGCGGASEGQHQAFEALIKAARNVHVWNSFYTQAEKTQTVFDFLLTNFPKRIDEFIRRTVELAGYRRSLSALPVRRGAQFLFEVGRPDQAVSLITTGVDRLIRLMANLELSSVRWTKDQGSLPGLFSSGSFTCILKCAHVLQNPLVSYC